MTSNVEMTTSKSWGSKSHLPADLATAVSVEFGDGFYNEEISPESTYRWMAKEGKITFPPEPDQRYLEFEVCSEFYDFSQKLVVSTKDNVEIRTFELPHLWSPFSMIIPPGLNHFIFKANKLFPMEYYPADKRQLACRFNAQMFLHSDSERHECIHKMSTNNILNSHEMIEGKSVLSSTAPHIGIDLHGVCNVKPPCVFCSWDENKKAEGKYAETLITRKTLDELGEFFDQSIKLINCSIGEPFLMKNFDEILDIFAKRGKILDVASNGQIMTEKIIQKLLGRRIHLCISLDAATPETYAKLRNNNFEKVIENVRCLSEAKGGKGNWPKIYMVFMPMKVNMHEIEAFIELCSELDTDVLVIRPLNIGNQPNEDRGGYHFDYKGELPSFEELFQISAKATDLCGKHNVTLCNLLDFGGKSMESFFSKESAKESGTICDQAKEGAEQVYQDHTKISDGDKTVYPDTTLKKTDLPSLGKEKWPICTEPWHFYYILRRGVMPCCFGHTRIASMGKFREAWNSPLLQELREAISQGRLSEYCLDSPSCPIVRKHQYSKEQSQGKWSITNLLKKLIRLFKKFARKIKQI